MSKVTVKDKGMIDRPSFVEKNEKRQYIYDDISMFETKYTKPVPNAEETTAFVDADASNFSFYRIQY